MAKKLFVRFATTKDEKDVFDFYAQHQHTFVFQRDPEVWKERIASGAVTLIHDEQGTIMAASISYPITKKDAGGNETHEWTEIGSVRVSLDGIGLVRPLVSAQVLRAWLFEPPNDRFVLEIAVGNGHSKHVFTKMGATEFDIPEELEKKVKATITSAPMAVKWFQMGAETVPGLAAIILDAQKNPILKNKKTGEEYELDFSRCLLTTQFQKEMQNLASQNFGDIEKPDTKKSLNSFKAQFNP